MAQMGLRCSERNGHGWRDAFLFIRECMQVRVKKPIILKTGGGAPGLHHFHPGLMLSQCSETPERVC
jgi:hypothetical protein